MVVSLIAILNWLWYSRLFRIFPLCFLECQPFWISRHIGISAMLNFLHIGFRHLCFDHYLLRIYFNVNPYLIGLWFLLNLLWRTVNTSVNSLTIFLESVLVNWIGFHWCPARIFMYVCVVLYSSVGSLYDLYPKICYVECYVEWRSHWPSYWIGYDTGSSPSWLSTLLDSWFWIHSAIMLSFLCMCETA